MCRSSSVQAVSLSHEVGNLLQPKGHNSSKVKFQGPHVSGKTVKSMDVTLCPKTTFESHRGFNSCKHTSPIFPPDKQEGLWQQFKDTFPSGKTSEEALEVGQWGGIREDVWPKHNIPSLPPRPPPLSWSGLCSESTGHTAVDLALCLLRLLLGLRHKKATWKTLTTDWVWLCVGVSWRLNSKPVYSYKPFVKR